MTTITRGAVTVSLIVAALVFGLVGIKTAATSLIVLAFVFEGWFWVRIVKALRN